MAFKKATKSQARLRLALIGPAGSGKTYTALSIARHLGERIALVDTERGSASKYADIFSFDVCELESCHPQRYIDAIHEAEQAGYDVLVIDSLSHAWAGKDGALELVDRTARRTSGNSFAAWREVTPLHNQLVDAMIAARLHLIVTMRSKTEWVVEKDERTGKMVPRKVGLQPVQRDGLEYEFDVVADMDLDNSFIVSKTRCPKLRGAVIPTPSEEPAATLRAWLSDGTPIDNVVPIEQARPSGPQTPEAAHTTVGANSISDEAVVMQYLDQWARDNSFDADVVRAVAEQFLCTGYKVDSTTLLADEQWHNIWKARGKLITAIEPLVRDAMSKKESAVNE